MCSQRIDSARHFQTFIKNKNTQNMKNKKTLSDKLAGGLCEDHMPNNGFYEKRYRCFFTFQELQNLFFPCSEENLNKKSKILILDDYLLMSIKGVKIKLMIMMKKICCQFSETLSYKIYFTGKGLHRDLTNKLIIKINKTLREKNNF